MKFSSVLLASACVLALAAPASAQLSATLGGGYTRINADHIDINDLNADAAFAVSWAETGLNFQGNMAYSNLAATNVPVTANEWNGGGSVFWADDMLRAGATINDDTVHFGPSVGSAHETSFGGFAEWFPGMFTVGVKAGDISGSGAYVGGEGVVYPMANLAISGTIDYSGGSGFHETDFTPQAEWLFSDEIPVSIYAGYTYANISGSGLSGNGNAFFVGLRFYANGNGGVGLSGRQRTGTAGWATTFGPIGANL